MNIKKGPWTVTDSKQIYKNPWLAVREDAVIRPDGKDGIFSVVTAAPGVSVIPYDDKGNVYLSKEYKFAIEEESIEAFSGGSDEGEQPLATAKRELLEESGITAGTWMPMGFCNPFTSAVLSPTHLFLATDLTFGEAGLEGTESIEIVKIPFSEALSWVESSKIHHAPTVILLLEAKLKSIL